MVVLANRPQPAPWPAPEPSLRVLQVCPREAPPWNARPEEPEAAHPAAGVAFGLCRALDAAGVHQQIVTAGPPRSPGRRRWGLHGEIHRVVPPAGARHLFGLAAAPLVAELAERADLIHVHPEGDPSALAVALWAARRHELETLVGPVPERRPGESNGRAGTAGRLPRAVEERLLRRAEAVLCPDGETLRGLAERGLPEELLTPLPWIGPRTGNDAGNDPATEPGEVAPAIRWGPAAGDLLELYRRVRRRTGSPGRGAVAGRPLAEATGEGR